eukprot:SAG31_NODE_33152_length_347_cov_0.806452_1_plen_59_part_01
MDVRKADVDSSRVWQTASSDGGFTKVSVDLHTCLRTNCSAVLPELGSNLFSECVMDDRA